MDFGAKHLSDHAWGVVLRLAGVGSGVRGVQRSDNRAGHLLGADGGRVVTSGL